MCSPGAAWVTGEVSLDTDVGTTHLPETATSCRRTHIRAEPRVPLRTHRCTGRILRSFGCSMGVAALAGRTLMDRGCYGYPKRPGSVGRQPGPRQAARVSMDRGCSSDPSPSGSGYRRRATWLAGPISMDRGSQGYPNLSRSVMGFHGATDIPQDPWTHADGGEQYPRRVAASEEYRELGEAAWSWALSQLREDDGPWLPDVVSEGWEQRGPGEDRDSLYAGIAGLAPVLAEIGQYRALTDAEEALATRVVDAAVRQGRLSDRSVLVRRPGRRRDGLDDCSVAGGEGAAMQRLAELMTSARLAVDLSSSARSPARRSPTSSWAAPAWC